MSPDTALPTLILTVGLPRSGKSTWAMKQGVPVVCPDAIRLALHGHRYMIAAEEMVWTLARYMVKALFLAGHPVVILDSCNQSRARRDAWLSPDWATRFHLVPTPPTTCIRRADEEGDSAIVLVIKRMAESWDDLGADEELWI